MDDPQQRHRLMPRLWLALVLLVALAVLVFAVSAYRNSSAPTRGSAGPLTQEPAGGAK